MKNSHKGFALLTILLIVAGILVVGGGGYWWYQNQTPMTQTKNSQTAGWKTYKNEKYGFEFKYPKEWEIPTQGYDDYNGNHYATLGCPKINVGGEGQCPLQVIATPASNSEEFLLNNFSPASGSNGKRSGISYKQINNIKTASFTNFSDYPGNTAYLTFFGNKYYVTFSDYHLSYQGNGVFDQILSTFKFNP